VNRGPSAVHRTEILPSKFLACFRAQVTSKSDGRYAYTLTTHFFFKLRLESEQLVGRLWRETMSHVPMPTVSIPAARTTVQHRASTNDKEPQKTLVRGRLARTRIRTRFTKKVLGELNVGGHLTTGTLTSTKNERPKKQKGPPIDQPTIGYSDEKGGEGALEKQPKAALSFQPARWIPHPFSLPSRDNSAKRLRPFRINR